MKNYSVETTTEINEIAECSCIQTMKISNGNYKCCFEVPSETVEYFESILDESDWCISYQEM